MSSPSSNSPSTSPSRGAADPFSKTCARNFIFPVSILASTATGELQSPCNKRRNSRSARKQSNVWRSFTRSKIGRNLSSSTRISIAMIPCPPADKKTSLGRISVKSCRPPKLIAFWSKSRPSRLSPAWASTIASQSFSASLRNRVGTLPRRSTMLRSGRFQES